MILTDKIIWLGDNGPLSGNIDSISNGEYGNCGYCLNPNNFYENVYDKLVKTQSKGVQVLCIAVDTEKRGNTMGILLMKVYNL